MNENEHKSNKLPTGIFLIILLSELFFNNQYYDSIVVLFIKPTWNVSRDWPYLFYHNSHALFFSLPVFPKVHIFQEKYFWEYILMLLRSFWFNQNSYPVEFQSQDGSLRGLTLKQINSLSFKYYSIHRTVRNCIL